jgi:hypothetical protein
MPKKSGQNQQPTSAGAVLQPEPKIIAPAPASTVAGALANSQAYVDQAKGK